jgi:hypothetical protein
VSTEAHLTLLLRPRAEPALRAWLEAHALRLTHIELSRGAAPRQTMITARLPGSVEDALARARAIGAGLLPLGIAVTRTKIEEAQGAAVSGAALYLEHHVKVRAPSDRIAELATLGAAHGAHLSRNPLRTGADGIEERFLTQRFPSAATHVASQGLGALLDALRLGGVPVARIARERVVFDDNLSLDAGWHAEISP